MNLMKILPAALLLSVSLNAFAQDEDETLGDVEEEATEVAVPTTPSDVKFFHRVQLGYMGTGVKYTNFGVSPDYNNYFLSGFSMGWMGDLRIAKEKGLFLELGANLTVHSGKSKDKRWNVHEDEYYKYKVKAYSVTIPVSINKQFKDAFGVEDLTLAPFAGLYFRFNVMAKRTARAYLADGSAALVPGTDTKKVYTASLMDTDKGEGLEEYGESTPYMRAFDRKLHVGKLLQPGVQLGVNAYYKKYTFGIAYMRDLTKFAGHKSSPELTSKSTPEGGNLPNIGTNCDEKVSTANNFMITVGYIL